jgi:hypothetical protein
MRRWRWRVADLLNRLPGQCWSDLVMWALREHRGEPGSRSPWSPATWACRQDLARNGTCYCGKIRADNNYSVKLDRDSES